MSADVYRGCTFWETNWKQRFSKRAKFLMDTLFIPCRERTCLSRMYTTTTALYRVWSCSRLPYPLQYVMYVESFNELSDVAEACHCVRSCLRYNQSIFRMVVGWFHIALGTRRNLVGFLNWHSNVYALHATNTLRKVAWFSLRVLGKANHLVVYMTQVFTTSAGLTLHYWLCKTVPGFAMPGSGGMLG